MSIKTLNTHFFKITSLLPILWISSLYIFLVSCIIDLGHYPIPSINDPKGIGIIWLLYVVWLGFQVVFCASILWLINLVIGIYTKSVSKKYLLIFVFGLTVCLIQIFFDPGNVFIWFMD